MELLNILIITLVTTLLIITLSNIKKQNDQIIIFMSMLVGLMILNLFFDKKPENFQVKSIKTIDLETKMLKKQYEDQKFKGFKYTRKTIKNFGELLNPTQKVKYNTEIIKLS